MPGKISSVGEMAPVACPDAGNVGFVRVMLYGGRLLGRAIEKLLPNVAPFGYAPNIVGPWSLYSRMYLPGESIDAFRIPSFGWTRADECSPMRYSTESPRSILVIALVVVMVYVVSWFLVRLILVFSVGLSVSIWRLPNVRIGLELRALFDASNDREVNVDSPSFPRGRVVMEEVPGLVEACPELAWAVPWLVAGVRGMVEDPLLPPVEEDAPKGVRGIDEDPEFTEAEEDAIPALPLGCASKLIPKGVMRT